MWYVYILECSDGSLYTGISSDVDGRLKRHNAGKGARYTRMHRPVKLLYSEQFDTKSEALIREIEIKNFSIENKKRLIKFGRGERSPSVREVK
jgi:putative endonuclease